MVREDEQTTHSVRLTVVSSHEIEAACSCCTPADMAEQWCPHAVALLYRASELEFFDPRGGFSERESTYRINANSPAEIATAIRELCALNGEAPSKAVLNQHTNTPVTPAVSILLDLSSDRLGIRVSFDDQEQEPTIFEGS